MTHAVRIALDLLGGDAAPAAVVDGALQAAACTGTEQAAACTGTEQAAACTGTEQAAAGTGTDLHLTLVGPKRVAERLLAERDAAGRFPVVAASEVVGMDEDPARAVRAKRDATVRVASRLVRDGEADAVVSVGSTGAAMAAALFTLGRVPGMTRPALAVAVPAQAGGVVLLDVGATVQATPDLLGQFALAGAAYARTRLEVPRPRVGLLSVGGESGKGDPLRKAAYDLLDELPVDFVGNVEGSDVAIGGMADVVVADGFTGNVLLKGLESAYRLVVDQLVDSGYDAAALRASTGRLDPEALGGATLLGVQGVCVIGHGSSSPRAVASCIGVAARAVASGLVPRTATSLAELVARRRRAPKPALAGIVDSDDSGERAGADA